MVFSLQAEVSLSVNWAKFANMHWPRGVMGERAGCLGPEVLWALVIVHIMLFQSEPQYVLSGAPLCNSWEFRETILTTDRGYYYRKFFLFRKTRTVVTTAGSLHNYVTIWVIENYSQLKERKRRMRMERGCLSFAKSLQMLPSKPRTPQKKSIQTLYPSCTWGSWRTPMTQHLLPLRQFERTEKMATQNGVPAACERVPVSGQQGWRTSLQARLNPPSIGHLQLWAPSTTSPAHQPHEPQLPTCHHSYQQVVGGGGGSGGLVWRRWWVR